MILIDTNVLARGLEQQHIHQQAALASMAHLRKQLQEDLVVFPQILIEFYSIATRSINSLKLTSDQALVEIGHIERQFPLVLETPDLYLVWKQFITKYKPTHRKVYDLRIAALMQIHQIPRILTFNDKDFEFITEIQTVNPFDLLKIPRQ
jgi:predicted nucleic acid-binding protein